MRSPDYSELYQDKPKADLGRVKTFSVIKSLTKNKKNILDIACGTGYLLNFVGGGTGIDQNAELIAECRKKYPEKNFIVSSCDAIPLKDEEFDSIIMCMIIEHLENPNMALQEAKRLLKKGSNLIIVTPRKNDLFYRLFVPKDPTHKKEYTVKEISALLEKYFTIDKVDFGSVSTKIPPILTHFLKSDIIINCIK